MTHMTHDSVKKILDNVELSIRREEPQADVNLVLRAFLSGMICYATGRGYHLDVATMEKFKHQLQGGSS